MAAVDIDKLVKDLAKKFGDDIIEDFDTDDLDGLVRIPTQSHRLNKILGGGVPINRITEIYGPEHTGKSSIGYGILAEAQRMFDRPVAIVDPELAFEPPYASKVLHLDLNKGKFRYFPAPPNGEDALEILETLIRSRAFSAILFDSVAAISPEAEVEAAMDQQTIGLQARLMSKALRKITPAIKNSDTAVIFINQERVDVGKYSPTGSATTTSGGKALKFYASVRLEVRRGADLKDSDVVIGHELRVNAIKNRGNKPKQKVMFDVVYGQGIDNLKEISELAVETGVIYQAGAWLSLLDANGSLVTNESGTVMKWQGKNAFVAYLRENPEFVNELAERIRTA